MAEIETGGGPAVGGNVGTGRDFVGRDEIINNYGPEGSIHARLSRLEEHIDWKFELVARDIADLRAELTQQKMRQSNNPTWFQVFMVIIAAAMVILLITFIVQLSAVQKRADAVRAQEITQQHVPK